MSFFADRQTLNDLNILGRHKNGSLARLFDGTITPGGTRLMDQMFQEPLADPEAINRRSAIFQYFSRNPRKFPFTAEGFGQMDDYLKSGKAGGIFASLKNASSKKWLQWTIGDSDYRRLATGVAQTIEGLERFYQFISELPSDGDAFDRPKKQVEEIYSGEKFKILISLASEKALSFGHLVKYDYLIRHKLHDEIAQIIELIYELDVYLAVAEVGVKMGFNYAGAHAKAHNLLRISDLFHPNVTNPVGNQLLFEQESNVIFLTGANMAGKSTLMKSFGIAIYLAHMGFPVAASRFDFSVKDGLYSSINVSDNISMGYSHFYAEVLRVKTVAEEVAAGKDLVVIFDELFKGTNVKDAYDATLAITEAFSKNTNCSFMISTHITEVGDALKERTDNFQFRYLPTVMEGSRPRYTYKLIDGITADRHGMTIIQNEKILELIKGDAAPRIIKLTLKQ
jgi:DNA mismatch repair ATPase MutS